MMILSRSPVHYEMNGDGSTRHGDIRRHGASGSTMRFREVQLPDHVIRAIQRAAADAYPEECCGLLIGTHTGESASVVRAIATQNVAEADRRHRYTIDPLAIIRADREAQDSNLDIIGVYHSHPDHEAVPSAEDTARAWEYFVYLIVPTKAGTPHRVQAWQLGDGTFRELRVTSTP
jgi:proteasome lid subunit RPN8/RPN11